MTTDQLKQLLQTEIERCSKMTESTVNPQRLYWQGRGDSYDAILTALNIEEGLQTAEMIYSQIINEQNETDTK